MVWIIGAVYNFLKAPAVRKTHFRFDSLVCAILALLILYVFRRCLTAMTFHLDWVQAIGTIILILSTIFTVWSRLVLGKMWANYAAVKEEHKLVTDGPYRMSRHPIYSGLLGMILGTAISTGKGFIFLLFIIALFFLLNRIHNEEQMMLQTFGEQYLQYKKRVSKLIPWSKMSAKEK